MCFDVYYANIMECASVRTKDSQDHQTIGGVIDINANDAQSPTSGMILSRARVEDSRDQLAEPKKARKKR